jgi:hypothetical protein
VSESGRPGEVHETHPSEIEKPEHGCDDRGEHDFEDSEIRQIELSREFPCASKPARSRKEPEADADEESDDQTYVVAKEAEFVEGRSLPLSPCEIRDGIGAGKHTLRMPSCDIQQCTAC